MSWTTFLSQVETFYRDVVVVTNTENPYLDALAIVAVILAVAFAIRTTWHL